jgi:putative endonuclease
MLNNKKIGKLGEDVGVKYLKSKGYKILDRNFEKRAISLKFGEIDIIAQKDKTIIFCEVKTFSSEKGLSPEQRVDFRKKETIAKIAEIWLDERGKEQDVRWQIDVLAIVLDFNSRKAKIRHFENV